MRKRYLDPARLPRAWVYIAIVALSSSASFGLGILEGRNGQGSQLSISELATTSAPSLPGSVYRAAAAAGAAADTALAAPAALPTGGQVVASKNGTKYYLPWCGGAKLIKDENKVWFSTKDAAEAAGYEPASNCKGL